MKNLIRSRNFMIGAGFAVALGALAVGQFAFDGKAVAQGAHGAEIRSRPLLAQAAAQSLGAWAWRSASGSTTTIISGWCIAPAPWTAPISQLQRGLGECCQAAPPVLEFDEAGNLLHAWGGPGQGYDWPESNHGIFVDHKGNVWIGGNGGPDSQILKFTQDGKFLMQSASRARAARRARRRTPMSKPRRRTSRRTRNDPNNFGRVAKIFVDAKENEAYIADGYLNHRVAVHRRRHRQDEALVGRLWQQAG